MEIVSVFAFDSKGYPTLCAREDSFGGLTADKATAFVVTAEGVLGQVRVQPELEDAVPTPVWQSDAGEGSIVSCASCHPVNPQLVAVLQRRTPEEAKKRRKGNIKTDTELVILERPSEGGNMKAVARANVGNGALKALWSPNGDSLAIPSDAGVDTYSVTSNKRNPFGLKHLVTDDKDLPFFTKGGLLGLIEEKTSDAEIWSLPDKLIMKASLRRRKTPILDVAVAGQYVFILYSDYSIGVDLVEAGSVTKVALVRDVFPDDVDNSITIRMPVLHATFVESRNAYAIGVSNSAAIVFLAMDDVSKTTATVTAMMPDDCSVASLFWSPHSDRIVAICSGSEEEGNPGGAVQISLPSAEAVDAAIAKEKERRAKQMPDDVDMPEGGLLRPMPSKKKGAGGGPSTAMIVGFLGVAALFGGIVSTLLLRRKK